MENYEGLFRGMISTPIGELVALASDRALLLLEYADRETAGKEVDAIAQLFGGSIVGEDNPIIRSIRGEVRAYFEGSLKMFSTPVELHGTDFQVKVWELLTAIPYGMQQTYMQQALAIGSAKSVRAVATANGHNHLAIVIPCHRVVGSGGKLTGYSGGLWRKQWLLEHEMKHSAAERGELF